MKQILRASNNNSNNNQAPPAPIICPSYSYDADGNLASDSNKHINQILYNFQDLPVSITFANGSAVNNIYDAAGRLIEKMISDHSQNSAVNTDWRYWGPFNYRNDSLIYILNDEGRVRYQADSGLYKYDFFVKDHLGNVRSEVTANPYPALTYWAGYEVANANFEDAIFNNVTDIAAPKPGGSSGDMEAGLMNGSDSSRIGTSLMLHVMAGDRVDVNVDGYWEQDSSANADSSAMVASLFSTLLMGDAGAGTGGESGASTLVTNMYNSLSANMGAFQGIIDQATDSGVPMAYLNYMVFDESMNFLPQQSGAVQIGSTPGVWQNIQMPTITAQQNGYLVTYLSNATNTNAWMDHMSIGVYQGVLLQEQNYYPFGLAINEGQAAGEPNKYLYQTKKLQDELGLNLYDFHARQYDAQIGRFWGIDPMDQFPSGYTGLGNDPANMIDPSGMTAGTHWYSPPEDGPHPPPLPGINKQYFADDDPNIILASAMDWLAFLTKSSGLNFVNMQGQSITADNTGGSSTSTGGSSGGPSQSAASMGAWSTANTGTSTNINMPTSENIGQNLNSGGDGGGGDAKSLDDNVFYGGGDGDKDKKIEATAKVVETADATFLKTLELGFAAAAKNASDPAFYKIGLNYTKNTGTFLGVVGLGLSYAEGQSNGWTTANKIDAGASAISVIPYVGGMFGITWFGVNMISYGVNHQSASENIGSYIDFRSNPFNPYNLSTPQK